MNIMTDKHKPITEHQMTLGNALKEHRLAANLSIDQLALKLNLKATVIDGIENNLEQMIVDKPYPIIYLRGYLANYSKAVQLRDVESYPEYQQLIQPSKSINTLSNPYILVEKPKPSHKFGWFVLFLFVVGGILVAYSWNDITAGLFSQDTIDTENIEMRLPEITDDLDAEGAELSDENVTGEESDESINSTDLEATTDEAPVSEEPLID